MTDRERNFEYDDENQYPPGYPGEYPEGCDDGFPDEFEEAYDSEEEQRVSQYCAHRRLQKNRMERKVRQGQMWISRLRFWAKYGVILLMILVGYKMIKLPQWYLDKDIFNSLTNTKLEILNNKIVPSYKILAALRRTDLPNKPIYRLETDDIKRNILQLDPIDNVFVRRFWFPARLQIIVEEKVPVITISPTINVPPIAFFASGGKLIGRDYMPLPKQFKTVLVLSYGTKGDDYRNWNPDKVKLIENIAKAVEANSHEKVEYIDVRTPRDVFVKVKTVNIRLGEIDDTVFERINRIPTILPQVKMLDKKIKYIDLRWKDANYIKLG